MELTRQQQAIVDDGSLDVVVTAGAGSGKTHTLVERYLALLAECEIPQIAAITFTEAAATAMRERVRAAVMDRSDLRRHRATIDRAIIGTIHSLCYQLLRDHPVEAGIDPRATVLAEDEADLELLQACGDALEAAADAGGAGVEPLIALSVRSLSAALPQMVRQRADVADAFAAITGPGGNPADAIRSVLREQAEQAAEYELPALLEARAFLRAAYATARPSDRLAPVVASVIDALDRAEASPRSALVDELAPLREVNLQSGARAAWDDLAAVKDTLKEARSIADALAASPHWNDEDERAAALLPALRAIFEDACDRYGARKAALAALDYLDLELRAVSLLGSNAPIAADYRRRLRAVMVDESQDTNPLQMRLIDLLTHAGATSADRPRRLLVGDEKQAIYGFRGSDVRLFRRALEDVRAGNGGVHELSQSFRAHPPLVEALNGLFRHVFGGAREAFEARMQDMQGRDSEPPARPYVTLLPIDRDHGVDDDRRRFEAGLVAREVDRLLAQPTSVWDGRSRAYRPAHPRDIAILLRRFTNAHVFEQALEERSIPFVTAQGAGFFKRQEVLDLANLLAWLAEPDDQIALLGVLRSPMFLIDDATLLTLREVQRWDLYAALRQPPTSLDADARRRCRVARRVLAYLRRLSRAATVDAVVLGALRATAVEATWAGVRGGAQAVANIEKLVAMARSLQARSLDEFVDYLRRRREDETREPLAITAAEDAVQLMTVHGAKGLEFPIVFLPEGHLAPWIEAPPICWRAADGVSLTFDRDEGDTNRPRPGFYQYLRNLDRDEEEAEHRRLFYVGATRAADYLYISGDSPAANPKNPPLGWLHLALDAFATAGPAPSIDVRAPATPVPRDPRALSPAAAIPPADREQIVAAPLLERPPIIPLRTSTPVTALRQPSRGYAGGHGDGLGALRGNVAHRAIELGFTAGRPSTSALVRRLRERWVGAAAEAAVAADVDAMLAAFDVSPIAAILAAAGASFEVPFAFDWAGVPVHGAIDALYRAEGSWHVLDFKTDRLEGRSLADVARPYVTQLGLYGLAVERATGARPSLELLFLRRGTLLTLDWADVGVALATARRRIDRGRLVAGEPESDATVSED